MNSANEVLAYRINDACRALGLSRTTIYRLISAGQLKPVQIAGRTLIPRGEIEALMARAAGVAA